MEISIDNRSGQLLPLERVEELAAFVLESAGLPQVTELALSFVDRDEITSLNTKYRAKPEPTDVLSFELDDPSDFSAYDGTEELLIGDVIINPDVAREHAVRDGLSLEEQLWVLVIHGILHLVGYDHIKDDQAKLMEAAEDDYLYRFIHGDTQLRQVQDG
jgi:probable rRNA maturation factor